MPSALTILLFLAAAAAAAAVVPLSAGRCSSPGDFACTPAATACVADSLVCDGRPHCPNGADELPELCKSRTCSEGQFACRRAVGRCLPAAMRCDGSVDCEQLGLGDFSDEMDCPASAADAASNSSSNSSSKTSGCEAGQHRCLMGGSCLPGHYVCDSFVDCPDGSDELRCPPPVCNTAAGEFACDGHCFKAALRCDGVRDCSSGSDELNCPPAGVPNPCRFRTDFHCHLSSTSSGSTNAAVCVPAIFQCDGMPECPLGEDEVCPIDNALCSTSDYWTCKSGDRCVPASARCDGRQHCPDGSDELVGCRPSTAAVAAAASPTTSTWSSVGLRPTSSSSSSSSGSLPPLTRSAGANSACLTAEFGVCEQLCHSTNSTGDSGFTCGCVSGYRLLGRGRCAAVGPAKMIFTTEEAVFVRDSESTALHKLNPHSLDLRLAKALAFDSSSGLVFLHTRAGLLAQVALNDPAGVRARVLMPQVQLDALAYDWTRRLLFYTAPETAGGFVAVADAATGLATPLRSLSCPRGIAVDPGRARLLLSLWCGPRPGIYELGMDGSGLRPLVTGPEVRAPGQLALDLPGQRLYWLDAQLGGFFSCRLDGSGLRAVWRLPRGFDGVPLVLDVFQEILMWTDLRAGAVLAVDRFSASSSPSLRSVLSSSPDNTTVLAAAIYHSARQQQPGGPGSAVCACAGHICVSGDGRAVKDACLCDRHFVMRRPSDGGCVPLVAGNASADTDTETASSAVAARDSAGRAPVPGSGGPAVTAAAAAAAAALAACLLVCGAATAAVLLLRRRRQLSQLRMQLQMQQQQQRVLHVNSNGTGSNGSASAVCHHLHRNRASLTKNNSQTPLMQQVDMEDQSAC